MRTIVRIRELAIKKGMLPWKIGNGNNTPKRINQWLQSLIKFILTKPIDYNYRSPGYENHKKVNSRIDKYAMMTENWHFIDLILKLRTDFGR